MLKQLPWCWKENISGCTKCSQRKQDHPKLSLNSKGFILFRTNLTKEGETGVLANSCSIYSSLGQEAPPELTKVLRDMEIEVLQVPQEKSESLSWFSAVLGPSSRACYLSKASPKENKLFFDSVLHRADLCLKCHVSRAWILHLCFLELD